MATNIPEDTTHSSLTSLNTSENLGESGQPSISKAEGKKRAIEDDEEATATKGEASSVNSIKKKESQRNKIGELNSN
ncbi:hypothetical protein BYT27DRAFT_7194856 [Phlegmacium glaucopus]|nr:hypothetical protein BYT27DRAFT_7194856 [Phlegmacium glaucopus]